MYFLKCSIRPAEAISIGMFTYGVVLAIATTMTTIITQYALLYVAMDRTSPEQNLQILKRRYQVLRDLISLSGKRSRRSAHASVLVLFYIVIVEDVASPKVERSPLVADTNLSTSLSQSIESMLNGTPRRYLALRWYNGQEKLTIGNIKRKQPVTGWESGVRTSATFQADTIMRRESGLVLICFTTCLSVDMATVGFWP